MTAYLRNPLTYVWAFLAVITVASWLLGRSQGIDFQADAAITVGVLLIAAVKAHLVIRYFMDVRFAPLWLKLTVYGWNTALFGSLVGTYLLAL